MKLESISTNVHVLQLEGNDILFSYQTPVAANIGGRWVKTSTKNTAQPLASTSTHGYAVLRLQKLVKAI